MILIVDRKYQIKSWLAPAPLKDLDLFDISGPGIDLQTFQMANLIVIADYEGAEFRVIKDRHTGEDFVDHISKLGTFLANWTFDEASTRIADAVQEEYNG